MQALTGDMDNATIDPVMSCYLSNSTSTTATTTKAAEHDVTTLVWVVGGPTLLAVGVIGNLLVLVTMTRRRMRGTSTCVYLSAMAVLDLMVLAAGLTPNWLDGAGYLTIKVSITIHSSVSLSDNKTIRILALHDSRFIQRRGATTAEKLRGPGFGSQHRGTCTQRPARGWAGVGECRRGSPPPAVRVRGYHPRKFFLKTQMLNPAFWWLMRSLVGSRGRVIDVQ